ncbi:MAG TPA: carboxypeptidase-like regulatory domain-containing protein [Terriglobia bacterium]|nr:carboxypeptidase-like regulatory domain-containing protein [Terriglobia bacterium]
MKKGVLLILLFSVVAFGQTFSSLRGTITDSAGRNIPGIRLIALGSSGIRYETTSDAEGAYVFDRLEPGLYTVRVDASDFKPFSREEVNVGTNGERSVLPSISRI